MLPFKSAAIIITAVACAQVAAAEPAPLQQFLARQGFAVFQLTKLPTGHEIISVTINGRPGIFVLDSGAGRTVVNKDQLAKFGLASAASSDKGAGAGGSIAITSHAIESFMLDKRAIPLSLVYGTDLASVVSRLKAATGVEIDGVVGQDILSGYGAIINIGASELYLKLPAQHG